MRRRSAWVACLLAFACTKPPPEPPAPPPPPVAELPPCTQAERIDVVKSQRSLTVHCVGGRTLVFPIALSRQRGPKQVLGDERMPEGVYRIAGPARKSRFHLFIPLDYPSRADAARGLAQKKITKAEHDAIVLAHRKGRLPPQGTALGGALGIHGEGKRWKGSLAVNWTEGCVALTDRDVAQVAKLVRPGTVVQIVP
jgi:murein L,D-transpeptidase YafK